MPAVPNAKDKHPQQEQGRQGQEDDSDRLGD